MTDSTDTTIAPAAPLGTDKIETADRLNQLVRHINVLRLGLLEVASEFALTREIDGLAELATEIGDELRDIPDAIAA